MIVTRNNSSSIYEEDYAAMPTYVYACDSCSAQFEQFQSFKEEPLRSCPSCTGAVRRVFQPVGIVFKGSGWYVTDSRKSSSEAIVPDSSSKAEKPASSESSASSEKAATSEASGDNKGSSANTTATE